MVYRTKEEIEAAVGKAVKAHWDSMNVSPLGKMFASILLGRLALALLQSFPMAKDLSEEEFKLIVTSTLKFLPSIPELVLKGDDNAPVVH